ncbi:MAG: tetratricopeptide repeat protein [Terriglobales bacterium]
MDNTPLGSVTIGEYGRLKSVKQLLALAVTILCGTAAFAAEPMDANAVAAEIVTASKAIKAAPTAVHYADRGRIYVMNQMWPEALADHTSAIKLRPNAAVLYARRGYIQFMLKDYSSGVSDCNKALSLSKSGDSNYLQALKVRANCYHALGKRNESIADLKTLVKLGDPTAKSDLQKEQAQSASAKAPVMIETRLAR